MDSVTRAILEELTPLQMAELHNQLPGVRPVTRFSDRSTAQARLRLALERAGMKLARTERVPIADGGARIVPVDAASNLRGPGACLRRITVLATECPKRRGSASAVRWALYRSGMTIEEYIVAATATGVSRPKARRDVYHDRDQGFISISE
jgi:hypothetical protein